ncbi:MAG: VWA domain-containing protein [Bacteroidia bacterium]|nr:VWA domain-containing protein [Bacteroidia bacterium]
MKYFFPDIEWAHPWAFILLGWIPIMVGFYIVREIFDFNEGELQFSSFRNFKGIKNSVLSYFRHLTIVFRSLAIAAIVLVIAQPQSRSSWKNIKTEGIDIVVSLDVSYSMLAKDFDPNRIEAAKKVVMNFIDGRPNDRIGLVIFGGEAFTQCPLTTDHKVIKNMIEQVKAGMLSQGTAIGLGLADAVARLQESKAKSKVIILITDGVSNVGEIAPLTAAEIAKTFGVRVYTVGVGTKGRALMPVQIYPNGQIEYDYQEVDLDEETMTKIADATGGKYFRATNNKSLEAIYKEIDKLEKNIILEKSFSNKEELYLPFAIFAAVALICEFLCKYLFFKINP